jgi:hypothetical protein
VGGTARVESRRVVHGASLAVFGADRSDSREPAPTVRSGEFSIDCAAVEP